MFNVKHMRLHQLSKTVNTIARDMVQCILNMNESPKNTTPPTRARDTHFLCCSFGFTTRDVEIVVHRSRI